MCIRTKTREKKHFQVKDEKVYLFQFVYFLRISTSDPQNAKRVEPCRRVHLYEYDKTFYYTLWFCILKSLELLHNVLKSSQITPEVPKSLHLGHIVLLGLAKTVFLYCPPPLPKPVEAPHTSNGLSVAAFRFKSEKKTYQWSQLGKIDPKDYRNKGVS